MESVRSFEISHMEKPVSLDVQVLLRMLALAHQPGEVHAPSRLIEAVQSASDPIGMLTDSDQSNSLASEVREQFGLLYQFRYTGQAFDAESMRSIERWATLMRWFINELQAWKRQDDLSLQKVVAFLVVSACIDVEHQFWAALSVSVKKNAELNEAIEKLISSVRITYAPRFPGSEPLWEKETISKLESADLKHDWLTVSELWRSVQTGSRINFFYAQAIQYLYHFDLTSLHRALSRLDQSPLSMQVADALPLQERLSLGLSSDNPHIQFGCVFSTFFYRHRAELLDHQCEQLLERILHKIANNSLQWTMWMRVFNRFPLRYPGLQSALGGVLATASDESVRSYIDTINLSTSCNGSRKVVAQCLRTFRTKANEDRAKSLWKLAYQRWSEWKFESAPTESTLISIGCSEIDFAVVGYIIECMTEMERQEMLYALQSKLALQHNNWHTSVTDYSTRRYHLLSHLQPYAHAVQAINLDEDWLAEEKHYEPFDLASQRYMEIMNSTR